MITNKYSMELSKYCFDLCETLKTALQRMNAGDLNKAAEVTSELERCAD